MLKQRVITALILAPVVLLCLVFLEPAAFSWFVMVVVALAAWEWANLSDITQQWARCVYAAAMVTIIYLLPESVSAIVLFLAGAWWFASVVLVLTYPGLKQVWQSSFAKALIGVLVLVPFWQALVLVREQSLLGHNDLSPLWVIFYMLALVWCADIGAYFAGKAWGREKLAPRVSPGKSWAGAWGGVSTSVLLALMATWILGEDVVFAAMLCVFSIITAAISIIGDLTESMFKRERGIKDSSQLLPGHGGIMDRIDSLTAAIPVFTLILCSAGWLV